ncbi:MAG: ABC transporter permease [Coriobacteriia bacterium]|nr:ABC transporter permease [Coriobacteriia bacterium]
MGIIDLLHETWASLSANKGRSLLTILGIVIGISSVIAMTSLVTGMRNMMLGSLGLNQARMVMIYSSGMTDTDIKALETAIPEYEEVAGVFYYYTNIMTPTDTYSYSLLGVSDNYFAVTGVELSGGRFFDDDEGRQLARVAVIGRGVNLDLFGDVDADSVGQTIRLGDNQESYQIIGITSGDAMSAQYTQIFIPVITMQKRIVGYSHYDSIFGLVREGSDVHDVCDRTTDFLNSYYGYDEGEGYIYVTSMQEAIDSVNLVMSGFAAILAAIGSISLFVGGIGIMNMMLTSVSERTREIGLRRSLGARTSDITQQFLAESIVLCLAGGFFGLIFGYLGAMVIAAIVAIMMPDTPITPAIGVGSVAIAVTVCVVIGLVFGYYPARRAAKLDPVESLRYQ